jgi:hypothetical protein
MGQAEVRVVRGTRWRSGGPGGGQGDQVAVRGTGWRSGGLVSQKFQLAHWVNQQKYWVGHASLHTPPPLPTATATHDIRS